MIDPAGNRTTRRHDHRKETQTAVVWICLTFIRSGQNHLARHSEGGKKARQTEEEVGRQRQGVDWPGVRQVPEGSGEQGKMEETGCKIICGRGRGSWGVGNSISNTYSLHCHHQNDSALRWAAV